MNLVDITRDTATGLPVLKCPQRDAGELRQPGAVQSTRLSQIMRAVSGIDTILKSSLDSDIIKMPEE